MATEFADILFFVVAVAIAVAQGFILRSTAKGMRHAAGPGINARTGRPAAEWTYAIIPAVVLALLLIGSWRAMHPPTVEVRGVVPPAASAT